MPEISLADGVEVTISAPIPSIVMSPPNTGVIVVPARGPAGPPGVNGTAGGAWAYHQTTPAAEWTLRHNLGIWPVPVILLDDHPLTPVWTDVSYTSDQEFVLTFPSPVTGWVHIN